MMPDGPPANHPAVLPIQTLLRDCDTRRGRGSGPGGQHRNKVETAIVLTHRPTGRVGQASERRSQAANRRVAVARLRVELALQERSPWVEDRAGDPPPPSAGWTSRVRGRRLAINPDHDDFPALLAEALDHLHHLAGDAPAAADRLGVSTSQLLKLLRHEPRGLARVNRWRDGAGQPPLR